MILLNLERKSSVPLFKQIFAQLKQRIEDNTLAPGFRMPSSRTLAEKHGVNRSPGSTSLHHCRISISTLDGKEIRQGISRLGKALSQIYVYRK